MAMPSKSQIIMYLVNFVMFIIGLVMLIVAAAVMGHRTDLIDKVPADQRAQVEEVAKELLSQGPTMAAAVGGMLFVLGILGCCAAKNYDHVWAKFMLCFYALLAFIILILAFAAGIIQLGLSGRLHNYAKGEKLDDELHKKMEKFADATFDQCCLDDELDVTTNPGCSILQSAYDKDETDPDACKNKEHFEPFFYTFLANALNPVGMFSVIVGVLALFVLIAACCLLWRKRKEEMPSDKGTTEAEGGDFYADGAYAPPAAGAV
jgi:protein-S-isoprenylcysteine O-methyltransferase Ste14